MTRVARRVGWCWTVAILAAGCAAEEDAAPPATASATAEVAPTTTIEATTPTTADQPAEAGRSLVELLGEIPGSLRPPVGELLLVAGDLEAASALVGAQRPSSGDLDELFAWLGPLQGVVVDDAVAAALLPEAVVPRNLQRNDEIAAELGWSVVDVRSFIELQRPPELFAVLDVDVTVDELTAAAGAPVEGIWRLGGETDGDQDLRNATAARPLGDTLRFAMADHGLLAVSKATPPVEEWLARPDRTLADDAPIAGVATVLDQAGVYSAMIVDAQRHVTTGGTDPPLLLPAFDLLGVGVSVVEDAAVGTFVYHYPSDDDADAAVAPTRRLFDEGLSVRGGRPLTTLVEVVDVIASGEHVIVTVTFPPGARPAGLWMMVQARDLPTVHG